MVMLSNTRASDFKTKEGTDEEMTDPWKYGKANDEEDEWRLGTRRPVAAQRTDHQHPGLQAYYIANEVPDIAVALSYSTLGVLKEETRQFQCARIMFERSLAVQRLVLGDGNGATHLFTARDTVQLGQILRGQGDYAAALVQFEKALEVAQELRLSELDIAFILNCIGQTHLCLKRLDLARACIQEVLDVRLRLLGAAHIEYSTALNTMGLVLLAENRFEEAVQVLEQALAIRGDALGKLHFSYSVVLQNIAVAYCHMNNLSRAGNLLTSVMDAREKTVGFGTTDMLTSVTNMSSLLLQQEDVDNAAPFQMGGKTIREYLVAADAAAP